MSKQLKKRVGREAGPAPASSAVAAPHVPQAARDYFAALLLFTAIIVAYFPVWQAGYLWDDDNHLTKNPCIVGPLGFKEIWTTSAGDICPLTRSTYWVEHAIWGLQPLPYHLVNVGLHALCGVLLWRVLRSLQIPGAWLGGALWALHPVQVESVAWISEMTNTESGLFFLLSCLFFLRWLDSRQRSAPAPGGRIFYTVCLLSAALAMAAKASTMTLPLVLALLAWWTERRWSARTLLAIVPVLFLSLAAGLFSIWTVQVQATALPQVAIRSWPERLITAGDAVWFYAGKLFWPHPLIFMYPRWIIDARQPLAYFPLLAAGGIGLLLWLKRDGWGRPWFFAFAFFVAALLPALGLVDHLILRYSFVFDHFQYLASMGPLALVAAGLVTLGARFLPGRPWAVSLAAAAMLFACGVQTWQWAGVFRDDSTLWIDTLAKNPGCWMADTNLGDNFFQAGKLDEAIDHYQKALALNPHVNFAAHFNLATSLMQKGRTDEAITQFQQALQAKPDFQLAHYNLGILLLQKGRMDEALAQFQQSIAADPRSAKSHLAIGATLLQLGHPDAAAAQFLETLAADPQSAEAEYNLALIAGQKGSLQEAIGDFQAALRLRPSYADAHFNLGTAYLQTGNISHAIAEFEADLQLNPNDRDAQAQLEKLQAVGPTPAKRAVPNDDR